MPKLTRKTQKIFCGSADNDQLAVFGSMATGTPIYTNDVEQLQGNAAYNQGWEAATLEDKAPFMEEMNGIQYSTSYQLAYLLQQGIAEWDSNTTYYTHSFVSFNDGNIYQSLRDNNIGNNPSSSDTYWKQLNLNAANIDLSNLSSTGEKHFLNKSQITNCLLEVPQRINLELNDGVLTLKAGSEVIVPNGFQSDGTTPKFDYKTFTSDITVGTVSTTAAQRFLGFNSTGGSWNSTVEFTYSGNTAKMNAETPSSYKRFYNTETNEMYSGNGTAWVKSSFSLPVCLITNDSTGTINSIDQIFNGFGYMGNVFWVDKGVKGLASNERNTDGTLKNSAWEYKSVYVRDLSASNNETYKFGLNGNSSSGLSSDYRYDKKENVQYNGASKWIYTYAFDLTKEATGITSLVPKQTFRALDYNEAHETFAKPVIGQIIQATASSSYVPEGTLPCDGAEYGASQFNGLYINYLATGKLPTCTYTEYSNAISTYGQCSKWALDTTNKKFRVPTILNKIVTGTSNANVLYDMSTTRNMQMRIPLNDSLGRLNMLFNGVSSSDNTEGLTGANVSTNYGQVQYTGTGYSTSNLPSGGTTGTVTPSKVNLDPNGTLYVNGEDLATTIEVRYFVVVANGSINQSMMDWSAWASSLNGKADKTEISSACMPSSKYIDLTLGASGTNYTASANGWIVFRRTATAVGQYLELINNTRGLIQTWVQSGASSGVIGGYIPVQKNDKFAVAYTLGSEANQMFRLIYAEGDV